MDVQRFEHACRLKDEGKFPEAFEEFIGIADHSEDPTDKAAATLYAAASLKMASEFQPARQQMKVAREILTNIRQSDTSTNAYHKLEDYAQAKLELEKGAQTADPSYIRQAQL